MGQQERAALSTKQLGRTVLEGRRVTFEIPGRDAITGYVGGMDNYHWMVVEPTAQGVVTRLVHKGGAIVVTLHAQPTLDSESDTDRKLIEEIVAPFRRWVEINIFGRRVEAVA